MIQIEKFWWRYEGNEDWVLREIDLKIKKGEFIGLTGPSGAGKSTLCMSLNGLIPFRSRGVMRGRIFIDGEDTRESEVTNLVQKVGLVFQDPETQFVTMSVEDELAFPLENACLPREEIRERISWVAEVARLEELLEKYPYELSGGEKQRVAIASMLALCPEVLVLDEPTSDLDPQGKQEVFEVIANLKREQNITLIVVEHLTEELAKYADQLILLYKGEIIQQLPPDQFFENPTKVNEKGVYVPETAQVFAQFRKKGLFQGLLPLQVHQALQRFKKAFSVSQPIQLSSSRKASAFSSSENEVISTSDLSFRYETGVEALMDINLSIRKGEFVAIIGQNGAGKTTLVKHFVGLLSPTKGYVKVLGKNVEDIPTDELATQVSYVFQNPDHMLFTRSVLDECMFGPRNLGFSKEEAENRAREALEAVGLRGMEEEAPFFLSKGQRQCLAVASVLVMDPDVIVVDEPTTGQDMAQTESIMQLLKKLNKEGRTIIVITHNMNVVAQHIPHTIVMTKGRIVADGPTIHVFANQEVLREAFLVAPQITRMAQSLNNYGFSPHTLTVREFMTHFNRLWQQQMINPVSTPGS